VDPAGTMVDPVGITDPADPVTTTVDPDGITDRADPVDPGGITDRADPVDPVGTIANSHLLTPPDRSAQKPHLPTPFTGRQVRLLCRRYLTPSTA
jgi:hypothetical protein